MCQENNTSCGDKPVSCYRIYAFSPDYPEREVSPFIGWLRPALGLPVMAQSEPFHALQSITDVKLMLLFFQQNGHKHTNHKVYLCKLSDNVHSGDWDCSDAIPGHHIVKTYTGNTCTILEEIPLSTLEEIYVPSK